MKKFYTGLILFLLFTSCAKNKIKENEPNNSKWKSQLINIPVNISGRIDNADIDYYKLIIRDNITNLIDIELTTREANPLNLDFYFQNRIIKSTYLLKENYENGEKKIVFKNISIKQGVYYIRVNKKRKEFDDLKYDLDISLHSDTRNKEREPNARLVEANYINITNGYIKGFFSPAWNLANKEHRFLEADWYKFNITEVSNILSVEITSIPGIDPVVELYNHLGFLIKKADSMALDEPEILKNFGILHQGEYFIRVYGKNKGCRNENIPYQLYLSLNDIDPQFEFEPNDSMNRANFITQTIKGYINPTTDIDWYTFLIEQEKAALNISITPLNSVDLKLALYNHLGEKFYNIDYYPVNEAEILPNLLLDKGKYFLTVSDRSNKNQNYLDNYTISIKQSPYDADQEYEPNNSFDRALKITNNNSYKGYLSPRGDEDCFYFHISEESSLKMDISPVPDLNFIIRIFDQEKNLIQELNGKGSGEGESGIFLFTEGTYYVILKDAENKSNFYENYIFSIFKR